MKKIRIDQLLVEKNLAPTRTRAQSLVMAGVVFCGTEKIKKSSETFLPDAPISVKEADHPYVGRGGLKLKGALDSFKLSVKDFVCLDVGASTGGFTDCLLQEGAGKVYALDVGYGQLDWKLKSDARVVVFDRTNFRNFDIQEISEKLDLIVMDCSFISIDKLLPKVIEFAPPHFIALIKPQFEVGPGQVGKGGIVKDEKLHEEVTKNIRNLLTDNHFDILGIIPSPITGQEGNKEFLVYATWAKK
ncbi:TlyA family RNA methyltransferase [bacterium]|nr:TlyA family RNA methyltransferase [bacterium]